MKISKNDLSMLQHFASVNTSVFLKPGKVQTTISGNKTILCKNDFEMDWPVECGIYDLPHFLTVLNTISSTGEEAELEFVEGNQCLIVKNNLSTQDIRFCDPSLLVRPPEEAVELPSTDLRFSITKNFLEMVRKGCSVNNFPNLVLEGDRSVIKLVATDSKNPASERFVVNTNMETTSKFRISFTVSHLKLIPDDYVVAISQQGLSHWKSTKGSFEAWVSPDPDILFEQ